MRFLRRSAHDEGTEVADGGDDAQNDEDVSPSDTPFLVVFVSKGVRLYNERIRT